MAFNQCFPVNFRLSGHHPIKRYQAGHKQMQFFHFKRDDNAEVNPGVATIHPLIFTIKTNCALFYTTMTNLCIP
jgi:hypothetical protein